MQYDRHEIAALIGSRVTVRRYVQPTLVSGDPGRELKYEHEGIVTAIDPAGRMVFESLPDPVWPEFAFLGGDPAQGTCKYLVTEILRDGEFDCCGHCEHNEGLPATMPPHGDSCAEGCNDEAAATVAAGNGGTGA